MSGAPIRLYSNHGLGKLTLTRKEAGRLCKLRREYNLSLVALAERFGIAVAMVKEYLQKEKPNVL